MASTPEAKTKKMIRKVLDEYGVYYAMPVGSGYGNAGVPDFLVCYKGWFIGVEAKAGNGVPTALQKAHIQRISDNGGISLVVYETDEAHLRGVLDNLNHVKELQNANT